LHESEGVDAPNDDDESYERKNTEFGEKLMKMRLDKNASKRSHKHSQGKVPFTHLAKEAGKRWKTCLTIGGQTLKHRQRLKRNIST
jgi:hypothetical protein